MFKHLWSYKRSFGLQPEQQSTQDEPPISHKEPFRVTSTKNDVSDSLVMSRLPSPAESWEGHGQANPTFDNHGLQKHYIPIDTYEGKHRFDPRATWSVEEEKRLVRKVMFHLLLLCSPMPVDRNIHLVPCHDLGLWLRSVLIDVRSTGAYAVGSA